MGGEVHLMGKPAAAIYGAALGMLALPPERVLAVGDSLEHDIAGAAAAGIDSVFVGGGIHAHEILVESRIDPDGLSRLAAQHGVAPSYAVSFFAL
jgi:ribonucleotide monophosphatase NagD (HAD superfamily)